MDLQDLYSSPYPTGIKTFLAPDYTALISLKSEWEDTLKKRGLNIHIESDIIFTTKNYTQNGGNATLKFRYRMTAGK